MDDLTPQPIQPAYTPGDARQNDPGPEEKKPRPRPEVPEVEAPEELIDSGDDQDEHAIDTFATSMEEHLDDYRRSFTSSLEAWKALEDAVGRSCEAIVRMELDTIDEQIANQERLASAIRRLEADQAAMAEVLEAQNVRHRDEPDIIQLAGSIEEFRSRVRSSNHVQGRLTAHSSQLVKRIQNALVRFFTTYPAPQAGGSGPRPGR